MQTKSFYISTILILCFFASGLALSPEELLQRMRLSSEQIKSIEAQLSTDHVKDNEIYNVDLCFMIDCTGSMGAYIEMAKEKIKEIVDQVKAQYAGSDVRIAIVGYRDFADEKAFEIFKFSNDADEAKAFLSRLSAQGGADTPEDVNGGFQQALYALDWKSLTRIVYHIADAPCHGRDFHHGIDTFPNGHELDLGWDTLFESMKNLDLNYQFFDIYGVNELMFNQFKLIYEKVGEQKRNLIFQREILIGAQDAYYSHTPEKKYRSGRKVYAESVEIEADYGTFERETYAYPSEGGERVDLYLIDDEIVNSIKTSLEEPDSYAAEVEPESGSSYFVGSTVKVAFSQREAGLEYYREKREAKET